VRECSVRWVGDAGKVHCRKLTAGRGSLDKIFFSILKKCLSFLIGEKNGVSDSWHCLCLQKLHRSIAENCRKLPNIAENCRKLAKIAVKCDLTLTPDSLVAVFFWFWKCFVLARWPFYFSP
jgi:hypothetical protein